MFKSWRQWSFLIEDVPVWGGWEWGAMGGMLRGGWTRIDNWFHVSPGPFRPNGYARDVRTRQISFSIRIGLVWLTCWLGREWYVRVSKSARCCRKRTLSLTSAGLHWIVSQAVRAYLGAVN